MTGGDRTGAIVCTDTLIRTERNRRLLAAMKEILAPVGVAVVDSHARTWSSRGKGESKDSRVTQAPYCQLLNEAGFRA
jgi:hypothetical protein